MNIKTEPNVVAETIATLAQIRMQWRNVRGVAKSGEESGFVRCAVTLLSHIERTAPGNSLWTTLPKENELNESSTVGDHLAVTRKLLGLTP